MKPGPDGFPGCAFILGDVLAALLDWLRRELWLLWGGSVQATCMEGHLFEAGMEPEGCQGCPYEEKCK